MPPPGAGACVFYRLSGVGGWATEPKLRLREATARFLPLCPYEEEDGVGLGRFKFRI